MGPKRAVPDSGFGNSDARAIQKPVWVLPELRPPRPPPTPEVDVPEREKSNMVCLWCKRNMTICDCLCKFPAPCPSSPSPSLPVPPLRGPEIDTPAKLAGFQTEAALFNSSAALMRNIDNKGHLAGRIDYHNEGRFTVGTTWVDDRGLRCLVNALFHFQPTERFYLMKKLTHVVIPSTRCMRMLTFLQELKKPTSLSLRTQTDTDITKVVEMEKEFAISNSNESNLFSGRNTLAYK